MNEKLSIEDAYKATFLFIKKQHDISGDTVPLSELLSYMSLLPDGTSADPAMLHDWRNAIQDVLEGNADIQQQLS